MAINPVTDLDWKIVRMTADFFPVVTDNERNPPNPDAEIAVVLVLSYGKDLDRINRLTNKPERYEKFRQEYRVPRSRLHEWAQKNNIDLEAVHKQVVQPGYEIFNWLKGL